MIDPDTGPFLFDASAESWIARSDDPAVARWLRTYLSIHQIQISSVTLMERIRGYSLLWRPAEPARRDRIEAARVSYLTAIREVWPVDSGVAIVAGELMSLLPDPPTPPKRSHRRTESRAERLARWRFDQIVASTALVADLPLIHNNATDFEPIRSAIELSPGRFPDLGPLALIRCALIV